jgi:hypothetical protein
MVNADMCPYPSASDRRSSNPTDNTEHCSYIYIRCFRHILSEAPLTDNVQQGIPPQAISIQGFVIINLAEHTKRYEY